MEKPTDLNRIPGRESQARCFLPALLAGFIFCFCATVPCVAQDVDEQENYSLERLAEEIARKTLTDPTSYAPAALYYTSARLDWDSSQPFFSHGSTEDNPRYTISGLPNDVPLSYGAGNRRILMDALTIILPVSFANNAASRVAQTVLTERDPAHRRRWAALAWIERTAAASALSYVTSVRHLQQWRLNERVAAQRGY
jgi:hypothetical protein